MEFKKEEYLKNRGSKCPYCGSDQIEGESVDISSGSASQLVNCLECNSNWVDIYKLVDVEE